MRSNPVPSPAVVSNSCCSPSLLLSCTEEVLFFFKSSCPWQHKVSWIQFHRDHVKLTAQLHPQSFSSNDYFPLKGDRLIWCHHPSAGCPGSHGDAFSDHWVVLEKGEAVETSHLCSKQVWPHSHLGHGMKSIFPFRLQGVGFVPV